MGSVSPGCDALTPEELGVIEEVVGGRTRSLVELRQNERFPFKAPILVAPYDGVELPSKFEYHRVKGRDISKVGISFFYPEDPTELLVMLLGNPSGPIRIVARVVHKREGFWERMRQFIVGCQFVDRFEPGES